MTHHATEMIIVLLALSLSIWLGTYLLVVRRTRAIQKRFATNCCMTCGYDLRATPSLRCPECGKC